MAKQVISHEHFVGGIADYQSEGIPDSYAFGRSIDHRSDPNSLAILPKAIKESGTVITDLPKWGDVYPTTLDTYIYGNSGNIYKRTSSGSTTLLRSIANSHGNGLSYFAEDDFLYYPGDKVIGRYGPLSSSSPQFTDDFLGSHGGIPLNTNSLDLESSLSQYADRADTASLSITGNLSIDLQIKPESLPTIGNPMVLAAKWTENGNARSYMFDIAAVSGYFGDGSDGTLTISSNTTESPIDSACTGTISTTTLSATNASFATGQVIYIHQSQGTGAGTCQRNTISSYTAGTITLGTALNATYATGAQVRVMPQYTNVTINSGVTYTAKAWNGTVGGILAFIASGTISVAGSITGTGRGFRGQTITDAPPNVTGYQGEGSTGAGGTRSRNANGSGGGAGVGQNNELGAGGGGGSNGAVGVNGGVGESSSTSYGYGATAITSTADLTTATFGGAGGTGGVGGGPVASATAGNGGGLIFLSGTTITVTGVITADGTAGAAYTGDIGGCGGGAGGAVLLKCQTATLGTGLVTAVGGAGGGPSVFNGQESGRGGNGGNGRVHLDYYTSYTGTTTPTLDVSQDNNLVTNTTYQLRLSLSSNGTNSETLAQVFTPQVGVWQEVGVAWTAASSSATFYQNVVALGTRTGAFTSISDNASRFGIGKYINSGGTATGFYDGLIDEVRIFNVVRSATDFVSGSQQQILTTTAGLVAYYKFNGDYADATANANDLTSSGSPVFSSDVPYPSPTTRLDIDQSATTAGNTYTVPTAISESSTNRKTFTPAKDPQKSIAVLVAAVGTGAWTITVHDQYNNVITSATTANASMATGYYEFVFTTPWRPIINANYHFHLTSTVADGTVTTTTASDLTTVSYRTYYQFLVTDTAWHPATRMLQFLVIGNERYLAKWEATNYEPNKIVFSAGERARCFGKWGEFLAIGVMRGASITDFDLGRIYFWDGIAPTYNFFIDVPEGGINALYGVNDTLYISAGYNGDLLQYKGGASAQKIKRMPKILPSEYTEIYPGAMTMWKSLLRIGLAGSTNSTNTQQGVYTYGSLNYHYEPSLSFDHPISTGNYGSSVKIGLTLPVGGKLLIGWQDGTSYGLDNVDMTNPPYSSATIEFIIDDDDLAWKIDEVTTLMASFSALTDGQTVNVKYKIDDDLNLLQHLDCVDEILHGQKEIITVC
jgi:hypothetical protein